MSRAPTSYDQVAYPSMTFRQSHPNALAVIARLHGIAAPSIETARVLHVGGGDGLDASAIAAAYPDAQILNFDIAADALARGRRWSEAAGLANVRHEQIDILDHAERIEGPFDYIVAHGIYAWVPDVVRTEVMPMIGRLLSPNGVAFVSYNALPGGHSRSALREMMLHHVRHIEAPTERLTAARAMLRGFAAPNDRDQPITAAMRKEAEATLTQSDGLFFHDIFNQFYAPQPLLAVTADAERHGLRYLGEALGGGLEKGFLDRDRAAIGEEALLDHLQAADYANGRYFRSSLFVRAETRFSRVIDVEAAKPMWVSTRARALDANSFGFGTKTMTVADPRRAELLHRLIALQHGAIAVDELTQDPDLLAALCHFAVEAVVELRTTRPPFVTTAGSRPVSSPLARVQVAEGERRLATLDHERTILGSANLTRLLGLLDGTHDRAALAETWKTFPDAAAMTLDQALQNLADKALLRA